MKESGARKPSLKELMAGKKASLPKPFAISPSDFITLERLCPQSDLPMMVRPALEGVRLSVWGRINRAFIEENLLRYGGLLFRDFKVDSMEEFESFALALSGSLLEYKERSSPRRQVHGNLYTLTDYPPDRRIFLHNENSYQHSWPMKILFFCETPAQAGGETPIADCRRILRLINPAIRERFWKRQWMYVRNFGDGFGLPWQNVFQTTDKAVVEDHCRRDGIEFYWRDKDRLRLRSVLPAMTKHPGIGDLIWFNHATFFHVSTLESPMRESLMAGFKQEDLPTNTYYGDGSAIEDSVLNELRLIYESEKVVFAWKRGDVLLLDNMLTAHGRNAYVGARNILVAMCSPVSRG